MPLLELSELEKISSVFRGRGGNLLARGLMHVLGVDDVNDLYDRNAHLTGPDFAEAVLKDIGLDCQVAFEDENECEAELGASLEDQLQKIIPDGPFITISNHPCGHVDGITLVDLFGHIRPDYKVMVNRILGRIEALHGNFIQVTPIGTERTAPTADSVSGVKAALRHLRDGGALGLFPAGAVSDLSLADRAVRDRPWQESVVRLIAKAGVPVLPVRFFDGNSSFYYSLGLLDWRIRLLRLLAEVFNKKGKPFRIGIGQLITADQIRGFGKDIRSLTEFLRKSVYGMKL